MNTTDTMTDLEFVFHYIEECKRFVNARLLGEASRRNLMNILNFLPNNVDEAKAIACARMAKSGKYFGDEEIDKIAGEISRLEQLLKDLNKINLTDAHDVIDILNKMQVHSLYIKDYFKKAKY